jgi:hypothetical protein
MARRVVINTGNGRRRRPGATPVPDERTPDKKLAPAHVSRPTKGRSTGELLREVRSEFAGELGGELAQECQEAYGHLLRDAYGTTRRPPRPPRREDGEIEERRMWANREAQRSLKRDAQGTAWAGSRSA